MFWFSSGVRDPPLLFSSLLPSSLPLLRGPAEPPGRRVRPLARRERRGKNHDGAIVQSPFSALRFAAPARFYAA